MVKITWCFGEPPKDMKVRQVYAIAFDEFGRMLLKCDKKNDNSYFGMIGGTPEEFDIDRIATLKREYLEEVNTSLKEPIYLVGYQIIEGDRDLPPYLSVVIKSLTKEVMFVRYLSLPLKTMVL